MLGYIYKLTPHECCEFYIGSSFNINTREKEHTKQAIFNNSKCYKKIRECGGFVMELLYEYECENKLGLRIEERRCYDELKPTLNTNRPYVSVADKIQDNKIYYKENIENKKKYNMENAGIIKLQRHEYYIKNAETIKAQKRQYYIDNIEKIKARKFALRQKRKQDNILV